MRLNELIKIDIITIIILSAVITIQRIFFYKSDEREYEFKVSAPATVLHLRLKK